MGDRQKHVFFKRAPKADQQATQGAPKADQQATQAAIASTPPRAESGFDKLWGSVKARFSPKTSTPPAAMQNLQSQAATAPSQVAAATTKSHAAKALDFSASLGDVAKEPSTANVVSQKTPYVEFLDDFNYGGGDFSPLNTTTDRADQKVDLTPPPPLLTVAEASSNNTTVTDTEDATQMQRSYSKDAFESGSESDSASAESSVSGGEIEEIIEAADEEVMILDAAAEPNREVVKIVANSSVTTGDVVIINNLLKKNLQDKTMLQELQKPYVIERIVEEMKRDGNSGPFGALSKEGKLFVIQTMEQFLNRSKAAQEVGSSAPLLSIKDASFEEVVPVSDAFVNRFVAFAIDDAKTKAVIELKELRKSPKEKLVDQKALSASGIDSILHDLKAARSEVTDATNGALMAQKKMKSIEQSITKAEKENVARLNVSDYGSNSFKRDTNLDDAFNAKKEKLLESLELSKVGLDSSKQDQSEAHSKVKEILARYKDATADRDAIQAKIDALDKGYESALSNLKAAFESYVHDVTESNKLCDASTKAAFDDFNKNAIALAKEISSKAAKYKIHNYKDQSAQEESIVRTSIADSIAESRKLNAETTKAKDIAAHNVQTKYLDAAKLAKTHDIFKTFVANVDVLDGNHSTYVQDSSNTVKHAISVYNDAAKQVGEKALDGFLSLFSHDAADDVIGSDLVAKAIVLQGEVAEHHIEIV
jgi:hypothetical protein